MIEMRRKFGGHYIPKEYQQVEYLESQKYEYINTDLDFNIDYIYDFKYKLFPFENIYIFWFGRRTGLTWGTNAEGGCDSKKNFQTSIVFNGGGLISYTEDYEKHHIIIGKDIAIKDGMYFDSRTAFREYDVGKILLFTLSIDNTIDRNSSNKVRFYDYKVSNSIKVLQHLIPCYRKVDFVAGMYDNVNDVFYTNAGTGSFIVGPDIN